MFITVPRFQLTFEIQTAKKVIERPDSSTIALRFDDRSRRRPTTGSRLLIRAYESVVFRNLQYIAMFYRTLSMKSWDISKYKKGIGKEEEEEEYAFVEKLPCLIQRGCAHASLNQLPHRWL